MTGPYPVTSYIGRFDRRMNIFANRPVSSQKKTIIAGSPKALFSPEGEVQSEGIVRSTRHGGLLTYNWDIEGTVATCRLAAGL